MQAVAPSQLIEIYRKALQYIVAQILGGFVAVLCVYKQDIDLYTAGIMELAAGSVAAADAEIFSPFGPAGILAIYPTSGSLLRYVFLVRVSVSPYFGSNA